MTDDQIAPREEPRALESHGAEEVAEIIARLGFFVSHGVRAGSPPLGLLERACTALARLVRERDEWIDEVARFNRGFDRRAEPYEALDDEFEQMGYVWANFDQLRARLDSAMAILEEAREFIYVNQSPRTPLADQCDMLDRIDSWLASGGKTT